MLALVDSDTPIYEVAITSEDIDLPLAKARLDRRIENIIEASKADEYVLYVSGGHNFRKTIDPSYKANRTQPDPKWREDLRLHLISSWGAVECVGYEADDACGCEQRQDGTTIIVGIDKDLLQIPGLHYRWPIVRKGQIVREAEFVEISEEEGFRRFFSQALTGDTSDNIKGIYGIGEKKAEKILAPCKTEEEMYQRVEDCYTEDDETDEMLLYNLERFERNLNLLWIWRSLGITYSIRREIVDS